MPRYPLVRAVDSPTISARVLYDFNDDVPPARSEAHAEGFTLGALQLEGDPDAIGVEWSQQPMVVPQTIVAPTKAVAMARLQKMGRALGVQRFWMMVQLTAETTPVWWHAYRTPAPELSFDRVYVGNQAPTDRWVFTASIDVDAFSYGARVELPAKTVGNNPANDSTAPSSGYNLPAIRGDAPSRLRVSLYSSATSTSLQKWLVTCISSDRSAPVIRVPIGASDGFTAGVGTAAGSSNAAAVGGSARVVTMNPGEDAEVRLSGLLPATSAPRGRYMVYLRCSGKFATGSGTFDATAQLSLPNGPTELNAYPIGTPQSAQFANGVYADPWQYVPLGVVGIGDGTPEGLPAPSRRSVSLLLKPGPLAVSQVLVSLDEFLLVPVSGDGISSVTSGVFSTAGTVASSTSPLTIDGDTETASLGSVDPSMYSALTSGAFPVVDPAAAYNTLLELPMEDPGGVGDGSSTTRITDLDRTATVVTSYHPRSAWLGDGS